MYAAGFEYAMPKSALPANTAVTRNRTLPANPILRTPVSRCVHPQQVPDPFGERTAVRRHGEHRSAAPLFHQRQRARVLDCVAAESYRGLIAAVLAFRANRLIQPPDRRMVKEQSLNANLENIHKRIEPPDVRQFVRNHRPQLFLRESG